MARKSALTDTSAFRFKDLELDGALVSWTDDIAQRFATHEYLKRDGAEQESMAGAAGRFQFRCLFLGPEWAKRYRTVVKSIRDEPKGKLVHPIFGEIQVACLGISGATVTPQQARDFIEFTLTFTEDAVDTALAAEQQEGTGKKAQDANDRAADLSRAIAVLVELAPAIQALGALVTTTTAAYVEAAIAATATLVADPTLGQKLDDVRKSTEDLIRALLADVTMSNAMKYEALAGAEEVYSAALEVDATIAQFEPHIVEYVVPQLTSLASIAQTLYASDAALKIDELLTLNRIPNPAAIIAGTSLRVTVPPVPV